MIVQQAMFDSRMTHDIIMKNLNESQWNRAFFEGILKNHHQITMFNPCLAVIAIKSHVSP